MSVRAMILATVAVTFAILPSAVSAAVAVAEDANVAGGVAKIEGGEAGTKKSVSQYGITWTFDKEATVGRFAGGDWYVVGPVTVVEIDPKPVQGPEAKWAGDPERSDAKYAKHGSMLNMKPGDQSGFDSRTPQGRYRPECFQGLPIAMKPGDSLISTISEEKVGTPRMMRPDSKCACAVRTAAVLTCVAAAPPADAFRPSMHDTSNKLYLARNLRRELLPSKAVPAEAKKGRRGVEVLHKIRPASWDQSDVSIVTRVFQRPWIDVCFDGMVSPVENMPQYGREVARAVSIGGLLLCSDLKAEEKEPLLVNMVQTGIDHWGALEAGHSGWPAHGGHGQGRKFLIVFAGYMLNDADMMNPYKKHPNAKFSEDMQTMYDTCWTGAKVVYAGHVGKDGLPGKVGWGRYEHLQPKDWPAQLGESYRRCCSSLCWVGEALTMRLMGMEKVWNHPAFFDYVDRWMNEDDTEFVKRIKEAKGWDFSADYARQRQCWDPLVEAMYAKYRPDLGPMNWK